MSQCDFLNAKLSNSQLNKLKSGINNGAELTSNVIVDSNDETNFPYKLLLTDTQVLRLHKTF